MEMTPFPISLNADILLYVAISWNELYANVPRYRFQVTVDEIEAVL